MTEPKPCPWCQGRRLWLWEKIPGHVAVGCSNPNCGAIGPHGRDQEEATQLWNEAPRVQRRVIADRLKSPRRIDRLLAEMHPPGAEFEA